jgi:hypothetical protein
VWLVVDGDDARMKQSKKKHGEQGVARGRVSHSNLRKLLCRYLCCMLYSDVRLRLLLKTECLISYIRSNQLTDRESAELNSELDCMMWQEQAGVGALFCQSTPFNS